MGGRCFVGNSKERGQLGQAVKGLSVAGCAVNKDAADPGESRGGGRRASSARVSSPAGTAGRAAHGFTSARAALASRQDAEPQGVSAKTEIVPSRSRCRGCLAVN